MIALITSHGPTFFFFPPSKKNQKKKTKKQTLTVTSKILSLPKKVQTSLSLLSLTVSLSPSWATFTCSRLLQPQIQLKIPPLYTNHNYCVSSDVTLSCI